jgi:hypothetical protein
LSVKKGEEHFQSLKVSTEFKGVQFSAKAEAEVSHKSFTEEETTSSKEVVEEFSVAPHTSLFLYQKVYRFRADVWFKLEARNAIYTVGRWKRDGVALCSSEIMIESEEYLQSGEELKGKCELKVDTVNRADEEGDVQRFDDCTDRCQSLLHSLGV